MAFDSISHNRLQLKLESSTINHIVYAYLHENNYLSMRHNPQGHLVHIVLIRRDAFLRLYYLSSLETPWCKPYPVLTSIHPIWQIEQFPHIFKQLITIILLYSDVGLRRALQALKAYCKEEHLTISLLKTKVLLFSKRFIKHRFEIELVKVFIYLSELSGSWSAELYHVTETVQRVPTATFKILFFFFLQKRVLTFQLMYSSQTCLYSDYCKEEEMDVYLTLHTKPQSSLQFPSLLSPKQAVM